MSHGSNNFTGINFKMRGRGLIVALGSQLNVPSCRYLQLHLILKIFVRFHFLGAEQHIQ